MRRLRGELEFIADLLCREAALKHFSFSAYRNCALKWLLAKYPHPRLVAVSSIHIDGQVLKVIDQFLKILRLDLR